MKYAYVVLEKRYSAEYLNAMISVRTLIVFFGDNDRETFKKASDYVTKNKKYNLPNVELTVEPVLTQKVEYSRIYCSDGIGIEL